MIEPEYLFLGNWHVTRWECYLVVPRYGPQPLYSGCIFFTIREAEARAQELGIDKWKIERGAIVTREKIQHRSWLRAIKDQFITWLMEES